MINSKENNGHAVFNEDTQLWITLTKHDFTITTPPNKNGKYIVPEDENIPKEHWGKECTNKQACYYK